MSDSPMLLDQMRNVIRTKHYSMSTEEAYLQWARRYILFHGKRHPREMGAEQLESYLSHLAVKRKVSAATQNQALSALLFLYKEVLKIELPWMDGIVRAKRPQRLPVVMSSAEVLQLFSAMQGTYSLMARLMYGTGMRLMEVIRLRVKDVDFEYKKITIRDGKGQKDRITMLPERIASELASHLQRVKLLHDEDLKAGLGEAILPYALARKYPNAGRDWSWQFIFPSSRISTDPRSGRKARPTRTRKPFNARSRKPCSSHRYPSSSQATPCVIRLRRTY